MRFKIFWDDTLAPWHHGNDEEKERLGPIIVFIL